MKKILFGFVGLLLISASALAQTSIPDAYPSLGRGLRPLGMGNAFLTMKGIDDNAVYYNPAAINDYEKQLNFRLLSPAVGLNIGVINVVKDVFDLSKDLKNDTTDSDKTGTFNTFFNNHVGSFNSVNLLLPMFGVHNKYFSLNALVDSRSTVAIRNRAFPNFELKTRNDGGVVLGGAYGFLFDDLQVGAATKFLYRIGINRTVTTNDILTGSLADSIGFDQWGRGFGIGADVGVKYKLPSFDVDLLDTLQPTVAVTYQDIGNTRFTGNAPSTPQSVSAGVGVHPDLGPVGLSVDIDVREMNQKEAFMKKFHLGVEARLKELLATTLSVRAGLNQGYPAAGFSIEFPVLSLDFAFYGEEMGTVTSQKADYHVATALNFSF